MKIRFFLVGREGFEPSKAEPVDLQSTPFDHSGIDPEINGATNRVWTDDRRNTWTVFRVAMVIALDLLSISND